MNNIVDDLNYQFNNFYFLVKFNLGNLKSSTDQSLANAWLNKLMMNNHSLPALRLRNRLSYELGMVVKNGAPLPPPFSSFPPIGPLSNSLSPCEPPSEGSRKATQDSGVQRRLPKLYEFSPDNGAFLSEQPFPKCGVFCYIAVVAEEPE